MIFSERDENCLQTVERSAKELGKLARYIEVLSIHFKRPGWRISFFVPRPLYRGSLNQGFTYLAILKLSLS